MVWHQAHKGLAKVRDRFAVVVGAALAAAMAPVKRQQYDLNLQYDFNPQNPHHVVYFSQHILAHSCLIGVKFAFRGGQCLGQQCCQREA